MDSTRRSLTPHRLLPMWLRAGLVVVPVVFLAVFYVWPVATLVGRVVDISSIRQTLTDSSVGKILWFTFWQAVVSTLATLIVGLGPAYLFARWNFKGRRFLYALVIVPFMLPTVVVGAAFVALLPSSMHDSIIALIIAHVFFNIAVIVRVVGSMWTQLPDDLSDAAKTLGASPRRTLREITFPLLRSSMIAASAIVFLFTFTSFGVVQILAGPAHPTIEVEIARQATQLGNISSSAVLAIVQLLILCLILIGTSWAQHRNNVKFTSHTVRRHRARTSIQKIWVFTGAALTTVFVALPLLVLVESSLRLGNEWTFNAWRTLNQSELRPGISLGLDPAASIMVSLRYCLVAVVISLVIGTLGALGIAVARRRGRLLDVGLMLPLGTSAVTIGFGMLITFNHAPVDWRAEPWLIPLGHALVAIPFVIRTILPTLQSKPDGWLDAATTLGASPIRAWKEIDLTRLRRPLIVSAGFAAAISLGEFGATTFLTRSGQETMPIAIARLLGRAGAIPRAQAFALATILAVVTTLIIMAIEVSDA